MEEWKQLEDYPKYQISINGQIRMIKTKRKRKLYKTRYGYMIVSFTKNKKDYYPFVHDLVVETFIRRYDKFKEQCHHINHVRDDNRLQNLVILSKKEHKNDPITRMNISKSKIGKKRVFSEQHCRNISKALKGKKRKHKIVTQI